MATMICVKHFLNIPDILFYSCFKNKNNKKGIFIWKIFIFHKNLAEKYVPMATMICVKHFLNIPDIFFLFLLYKNNTKKGLLKKIIFHKNLGKNMLP
jgi:hypothetical protein